MREKKKVYAYIIQAGKLVVFEHLDAPEAGIQVPGGTVEEGESLSTAVLREATEETGLQGLVIARYLGSERYELRPPLYDRDEVHIRHFYELHCAQPIPDHWEYAEHFPSEGKMSAIPLRFYCVPLAAVPSLVAGLDARLMHVQRK